MRLNPMAPAGLRLLAGIVFFNAQQYDRAIAELEPVVKAWPDAETPHEYLSASYALHGDAERARPEVEALPDFPQDNLAQFRLSYADQSKLNADLEHFLKGLAAAGMPQWPFGFEGNPRIELPGSRSSRSCSARLGRLHSAGSRKQCALHAADRRSESRRLPQHQYVSDGRGARRERSDLYALRRLLQRRMAVRRCFPRHHREAPAPAKATSTCCPTGCVISRSNPDARVIWLLLGQGRFDLRPFLLGLRPMPSYPRQTAPAVM